MLLFALSLSFASEIGPPRDVLTPYGPVSAPTAHAVCGAEHVFVGRIVNEVRYARPLEDGALEPVVDLTFEVEATAAGEPGELFALTLRGTPHPVHGLQALHGQPEVGLRYAIAAHPYADNHGPGRERGRPYLVRAWPVPDDADVPAAAVLEDQLDTFCAMNGMFRAAHKRNGL